MPDRLPLAFSTLGCPNWTLEQAASAVAAQGYRGIEIRLLDGDVIAPDLSQGRRKQIRELMQNHDLEIVALGASTRFSSPDAEVRQANLDDLRRYLELAQDLGAHMVRTFGGNVEEGTSLEQTIGWVAENLAEAVAEAEEAGVTIGIETHDAFCRGAEVARVLNQVPSPWLAAIWDVHHPYRMGESMAETWDLIGERVKHVHIKDARRKPDGSWQLVLLGEGEVPCRQIIDLLLSKRYKGFLTAEWEKKWHPEIEEPEEAIPQHARVLREWMNKPPF
jgi:sugar phosphate isomerase/epimerase